MHPASFIFVILKPFYHTFAYSKQQKKKMKGEQLTLLLSFLNKW